MRKIAFTTRKIVLYGLGCALFVVVGCVLPIPIPNTTAHIDLGYVVMAIFAYLYGPIAGGLIGGMGRFLEDMILFGSIGSPGWLIASILMGMLIGLTFKFTQKGDNPQIALMIQIILILIINAVLLIGLSPFISSLWHGVPYITKLPSGLSAFLTNSFAIIVIGIPIGRILEKMLKKS